MKNFKIAMILVAAVAFLSSCGKEGPSITFAEKDGIVTYDLSQTSSLNLNFEGSVTAEAGIETLKVTQTIKDANDTVVKAFEISLTEDPAGKTEYTLNFTDVLKKVDAENNYSLAKGYTVVYDVECVDKKEQTDTKSWTVNITETATPLSANWQGPIYLAHPTTSSYASINGTNVSETESTIIGVKVIENNSSHQTKIGVTTNCEGFVVVTEDYASVEELEAAYTAGSAATSIWLDAEYHAKNYAEKKFIAKVDNAYVLVKYTSGDICPNGWNNITGNVYGFEYKKAETTPAAAK